jgi:hypothetical protein
MTAIKEQWDKAAAVGETMEDIDRERVERLPYEVGHDACYPHVTRSNLGRSST